MEKVTEVKPPALLKVDIGKFKKDPEPTSNEVFLIVVKGHAV